MSKAKLKKAKSDHEKAQTERDEAVAELEALEEEITSGFKKADQMMADREKLLIEVQEKQHVREDKLREVSVKQGTVAVLADEVWAIERALEEAEAEEA